MCNVSLCTKVYKDFQLVSVGEEEMVRELFREEKNQSLL